MSERTVFRTCPLCEATCGLAITIADDNVVAIRGDDDDVFSRGFVCPKGAALAALHHDADRLRAPVLREGGAFREVTWAEAFAFVAERLPAVQAQHGREAVGVYLGNPNAHNFGNIIFARPLIQTLGTKHLYTASTADQMPKHVVSGLLYGDPDRMTVPDLDRTDLLVILGANPLVSGGSLCTAPDWPGRLKALRARGGRLVVIDPVRTRTAEVADLHLPIRPGGDAWLLLAIAHSLLDRKLARPGHLQPLLDGFDDLPALLAPFTLARAAARSGIPAEAIEALANDLAAAPSAAVYARLGVHTSPHGTLGAWAAELVNILTGNLDREGGAMFPRAVHHRTNPPRPGGRGFQLGRWKSRVRSLPEVRSELPVATLAEEIETPGRGQLRALITIAGNPVLSTPDGERLDRALAGLDLMIAVDPYINETTRHAHVILPPPSTLARSHYDIALYNLAVRAVARWSPPAFAHEGPAEEDILNRLTLIAAGLGADADPALVVHQTLATLLGREVLRDGSPIAGQDPDALLPRLTGDSGADRVLDLLLRTGPFGDAFGLNPQGLSLAALQAAPHGIDLGPMIPQLPHLLTTPSAKIELLPASIRQALSALDADAEAAADEPLRLVGRRTLRSNNSWMHNLPLLVRGKNRCTLQLHPEDAAARGLQTGDTARVTSRVGAVEAPVEVTEAIAQGVVSLPHGWGHGRPGARLAVAAAHAGVNANALTDPAHTDPISGNAVLNGVPVEVTRKGLPTP